MIDLNRNDVIKALYLNANESGKTGNDKLLVNIDGLIDSLGENSPEFYELFCVDGQSVNDRVYTIVTALQGIAIAISSDAETILFEMLDINFENNNVACSSNALFPLIDEHHGFVPYLLILELLSSIEWFNSERFNDFNYINSLIIAMDCEFELKEIWFNHEGDILYQFVEIE